MKVEEKEQDNKPYYVFDLDGDQYVIPSKERDSFKMTYGHAREIKGVTPIIHNGKVVEVKDSEVGQYLQDNAESRPFYEGYYAELNPLATMISDEARAERERIMKKTGMSEETYIFMLKQGDYIVNKQIRQHDSEARTDYKELGIIGNKIGFKIKDGKLRTGAMFQGTSSTVAGMIDIASQPFIKDRLEFDGLTMTEQTRKYNKSYMDEMLKNEGWIGWGLGQVAFNAPTTIWFCICIFFFCPIIKKGLKESKYNPNKPEIVKYIIAILKGIYLSVLSLLVSTIILSPLGNYYTANMRKRYWEGEDILTTILIVLYILLGSWVIYVFYVCISRVSKPKENERNGLAQTDSEPVVNGLAPSDYKPIGNELTHTEPVEMGMPVNTEEQEKMTICPKCGTLTDENDNFCSKCGCNLQTQGNSAGETEIIYMASMKADTQHNEQPIESQMNQEKGSKMTRNLMIFAVFVIGFILLVAVINMGVVSNKFDAMTQGASGTIAGIIDGAAEPFRKDSRNFRTLTTTERLHYYNQGYMEQMLEDEGWLGWGLGQVAFNAPTTLWFCICIFFFCPIIKKGLKESKYNPNKPEFVKYIIAILKGIYLSVLSLLVSTVILSPLGNYYIANMRKRYWEGEGTLTTLLIMFYILMSLWIVFVFYVCISSVSKAKETEEKDQDAILS